MFDKIEPITDIITTDIMIEEGGGVLRFFVLASVITGGWG
jgi:hypothetical protein